MEVGTGIWRRRAIATSLALVAMGLAPACTAGPTLPVPPPAIQMLTVPDDDGLVTAGGVGLGRAFIGCVNTDTDDGVIRRADDEGRWTLSIRAESGDTLLFFQLTDEGRGVPVERLVPGVLDDPLDGGMP